MKFDFTRHKVVGVAECKVHNDNASIKPIGYLDETWNFIPLSADEILESFPSRGSVFAYNFRIKQPTRVNKGILLGVMPSNNDGKDSYVWDYSSGAPDEYFTVIKVLSHNLFDSTPDAIYERIQAKGWLDMTERFYRFYENTVYCIDPKDIRKRYVKFWNIESVNKEKRQLYPTIDKMYYALLSDEIDAPCSYIDIMPSSELNEWLINKFLVPEWSSVLSESESRYLEDSLKKLMEQCKWPKGLLQQRLKRAFESIETVVFSAEQIKKLMEYPKLKDIITSSIKDQGAKILKEIDFGYSEQLKERKIKFEKEIANEEETKDYKILEIQDEIEKANKQYKQIIEDIKVATQKQKNASEAMENEIDRKRMEINLLDENIDKIQARKEDILGDFNVVKEVLQLMNVQPTVPQSTVVTPNQQLSHPSISSIDLETSPIKNVETFTKRLERFLQLNNRKSDIAKRLLGYIIHYNTLLLPDSRILLSVLKATGNCKYSIQYVNPEWRSFDSVWNNGLAIMVESCKVNPEILNYFVLQNCNLTYLPCILQPIVDMSLGLLSRFPGTDLQFPKNLRIVLTLTEEEALPVAAQNIRYFGCLKKDNYVSEEGRENEKRDEVVPYSGYLSMKAIEDMSYTPIPASEFQSYITDYGE